MKKTTILKKFPFLSTRWMHIVSLVLVTGVIGGGGVTLTLASHAGTGHANGIVTVSTYEGATSVADEIGSVNVTISHVGASTPVCSPSSGATDPAPTSNHGHISFSCPVNNSGAPLTYVITSATRGNYSVSPTSEYSPGTQFSVASGATINLRINMVGPPPAATPSPTPAPAPASTPAPAPAQPTSHAPGTMVVSTYEGATTVANELGNVVITPVHAGVACTPSSNQTDAAPTSNKGHVSFSCPVNSNGAALSYAISTATKSCYSVSPSSEYKLGQSTISIASGQITQVHINMVHSTTGACAPAAAPAPAPAATSSTPQGSTGSTTTTGSSGSTGKTATGSSSSVTTTQQAAAAKANTDAAAAIAKQKNGTVEVTAYIYRSASDRTRVGSVNLHIQSVGYETTDADHSCTNYNQTTDGSGQVHFTQCWTGATGVSKAYQLSFTQLPAGLTFRSYHITGPSGATFLSGATSMTNGIGEQFKVLPNQTTKLEINLTQAAAGQAVTDVSQVVTQKGGRFVPINATKAAKDHADALNLVVKGDKLGINNLQKSGSQTIIASTPTEPAKSNDKNNADDTEPPSIPANFKAVEDASGSVSLTWDASAGSPAGEHITYSLERTDASDPDSTVDVGDPTSSLSALDDAGDLEYPRTYIYDIVAADDASNISDPTTVQITTTPPVANVPAAAPAAATATTTTPDSTATNPTTTASQPASEPVVTIVSPDQTAALTVPADATSEDLSCDISDSDNTGDVLLDDLGDTDGSYVPVCRNADGSIVDDFVDDVDESVDAGSVDSGADLYGYDGTDWVQIPTDQTDQTGQSAAASGSAKAKHGTLTYASATKTKDKNGKVKYTVKTKHLFALALVNKKGNSVSPVVPITTLLLLAVVGVAARTVIRKRIESQYAPFPYSGDPDLTPMQPSVEQPVQTVQTEQPVQPIQTVQPEPGTPPAVVAPTPPIPTPGATYITAEPVVIHPGDKPGEAHHD